MYLGAHTIETIHLLHLFPSQIAYREFAPYFILLPSLLEVPNESKHVSVELTQIGTTNSTSTETVFSDIGAQLWGPHTQVLWILEINPENEHFLKKLLTLNHWSDSRGSALVERSLTIPFQKF